VQKLRVQYAKRGRARFASHRDFGRAFDLPGELRREDVHDMARIYMLAFSKGLAVASKGVKP
jgi:uncharacterized protein (DUF2344 family)